MKTKEEIIRETPKKVLKDFNDLKYDPNAEIKCDTFNGNIYWSDEITTPLAMEFQSHFGFSFALLLAYRNSLILGEEDEGYLPHWELAKSIFPNWPLFRSDRYSSKYREKLLSIIELANKEYELLINERHCLDFDSSKINFQQFPPRNIVNQLLTLKYNPNAIYRYDLDSDSLIWSDEIPEDLEISLEDYYASEREPSIEEQFYMCFLQLVHYRASLIENFEEKQFRPLWNRMRKKFPSWPIFRPERHKPCLEAVLENQRKKI